MDQPLLPLTNPYVFQQVFGDESHSDSLRSFLSAVIEEPIIKVSCFPRKLVEGPQTIENTFLDIGILIGGKTHNVQVQVLSQEYRDFIAQYWLAFCKERYEADYGFRLTGKIITISIIHEHDIFPHYLHSLFQLMEEKQNPHHILTDMQEIHVINMAWIEKTRDEPNEELIRWMRFLTCVTKEEMEKIAQEDACIEQIYHALVRLSQIDEERDHAYVWDDSLE